MKLVEILARELEVWPVPDEQPISQFNDGRLFVSCAYTKSEETFSLGVTLEVAEDHQANPVTRPQWQAERERIIGMETQQATASVEPSYEQQLWDKAYMAAWTKSLDEVFAQNDHEVFSIATSGSAKMADAFMAERAKRLHKQD